MNGRTAAPTSDSYGVTPEQFEQRYRRETDPWDYESSPYERAKYEATLDAAGPGPFASALELGCSIGVFTELLAPRCQKLLALDGSETALARARARLANSRAAERVSFEHRILPDGLPAGPFDLVVCSEVLYYWSEPLVLQAADRLAGALAEAAAAGTRHPRLVAVHWRRPGPERPLTAERVHALLGSHRSLEPVLDASTEEYLLHAYEPAAVSPA